MKKYILIIIAPVMVIGFLSGCSGKQGEKTINVSAAISLKDVLNEVSEMYMKSNPGVKINFNYGSSGTLQQQIEQGAPVDAFVSAEKQQMNVLWNLGLVEKPVYVAGNNMVLVVPAGQQNTTISLQQLGAAGFGKIAIGTPETVPAGKYAREALVHAGVWADIYPKLVMAKDVRQVLVYVETGNADAGLVYRSDALASTKVKIAYRVPAAYHAPIIYPAAVVRASRQQEQAARFLRFLLTPEAQAVFKKYGFTPVENR